jgi:hypothetical protein
MEKKPWSIQDYQRLVDTLGERVARGILDGSIVIKPMQEPLYMDATNEITVTVPEDRTPVELLAMLAREFTISEALKRAVALNTLPQLTWDAEPARCVLYLPDTCFDSAQQATDHLEQRGLMLPTFAQSVQYLLALPKPLRQSLLMLLRPSFVTIFLTHTPRTGSSLEFGKYDDFVGVDIHGALPYLCVVDDEQKYRAAMAHVTLLAAP